MDDLANYFFRLSRSHGMIDLRSIRVNYYTVSILRVVAQSSWTSVATQIIWMPPDGHYSNPSLSFSNTLTLPPPTHLSLPWLPSPPRYFFPSLSFFLCGEGSLIRKNNIWGGHIIWAYRQAEPEEEDRSTFSGASRSSGTEWSGMSVDPWEW